MNRAFLALFFFLSSVTPAFAWGEKGHLIASEAATRGTPVEMPHFFHERYPQLIYLGYDPDRIRGAGQSIDAFNAPNHFLDIEYVDGLKLSPNRYEFINELYASGRLRSLGIEVDKPGFVPWRIAELAEELTQQFRMWRRSLPGSAERGYIEDNVIRLAGILGHFVADSANPHHASIHYNGWAGVPNPNRYPNDCETHGRFETQFVSRVVRPRDVFSISIEPKLRENYFEAAIELIRESKTHVENLYRMDRDGAFTAKGTDEGRRFAAARMAQGGAVLRDLWWSAWVNSGKEPPRRPRS